jgi:hypothetical protein
MTARRARVVALDLPTVPDDGDHQRRTPLLAKSAASMALGGRDTLPALEVRESACDSFRRRLVAYCGAHLREIKPTPPERRKGVTERRVVALF